MVATISCGAKVEHYAYRIGRKLRLAGLVLAALCIVVQVQTAQAQTHRGYQHAIAEGGEGFKRLPAGFHDFEPLSEMDDVKIKTGNGIALCSDWRTAISLGRRIGFGNSPEASTGMIQAAWRGKSPCTVIRGLHLTAIAVAVRGDQDGTAIRIVKYVDQHGRVHFSGAPVADRQANKRRRTQQAIASRL